MTKVLIADDHPADRAMLQTLLVAHGFEVTAVSNGAQALRAACETAPDLAITDILMPVMDGFSLARHWVEHKRLREVPLLVYSATYVEKTDAQLALDMGASRFLIKPAEPAVLVGIVAELLAQKPARPDRASTPEAESVVLRRYNQALVRKLEDKVLQLAEANADLETTSSRLREDLDRLDLASRAASLFLWEWDPRIDEVFLEERTASELFDERRPKRLARDAFLARLGLPRGLENDAFWSNARTADASPASCEWTVLRGGLGHWYEVRARVHDRDERGAVRLVLGTLLDVSTARRSAQERLELVRKLDLSRRLESVGRLAGGLAHDFKNLLVPILGHAELASNEVAPDSSLAQHLAAIRLSAERARSLSSRLLSISKEPEIELQRLDLREVLEGIMPILRHLLSSHVDLRWSLASGSSTVLGDRVQLEQVLMNLTVNANEAMPGGGTLSIELGEVDPGSVPSSPQTPSERWVRMRVADTGRGIPEADRERVFEPFYSTKATGQGTGIGLSTVHAVIARHRGRLTLDSQIGRGTSFEILLPLAAPEAERDRGEAARAEAGAPCAGRRLLLVDDEAPVRGLIRAILQREGHHVVEARSGHEAIDLASRVEGGIDLLVSDVLMPEMSGPQLWRELSRRHPGLRVLFVSGDIHEGRWSESVHALGGPDASFEFLPKPFDVKGLLDAVARALST